MDFFSVGGRYRNNWAAAYGGGWGPGFGSERTSYFNFNPKWNSRYIDLLAANGQAKVVHQGELVIRNNTPASFARTTQIFYMDDSQPVPGSNTKPDLGVGAYELLSAVINRVFAHGDDLPVGKGNQQITAKSAGYGFTMKVENASVNLDETRFKVTLDNTSLLGFLSNGAPRISSGGAVSLEVSLPHGKDSFVIGGLTKKEVVRSRTGIPWLCEIPYLEYIFGSVSTSIKQTRLVVAAQCEWDSPSDRPALCNTTIRQARSDFSIISKLYQTIMPYIVTDTDLSDVIFLAETFLLHRNSIQMLGLEGTMDWVLNIHGYKVAIMYPDEDNLFETMLDVYYKPID